MKTKFTIKYINEIHNCLNQIIKQENKLIKLSNCYKKLKKNNKIITFGNGGSITSTIHFSNDFTKVINKKSISLSDSDLITCYSNDYGFENFVKQAINSYYVKNDLVILVSVSGESKNILSAAKFCVRKNINLITLSSFKNNNSLMKINNKGLNFHIKTNSYNIAEISHLIILLLSVDLTKNKMFYKSSIGKI
jgi:D-sedoheptulose 7-phosphate isomerase